MLNVTYIAAQCTHTDPEQTQMLNVMHITAHTDPEQTQMLNVTHIAAQCPHTDPEQT